MAVKAVHLELVSNLSSDVFITALQRFYCTKGEMFIFVFWHWDNICGSSSRTSRTQETFCSGSTSVQSSPICKLRNTDMALYSSHSPHFVGLWDAGMSFTKYHLKELVGIMAFTFKELGTLLTQVQACLNSCPLTDLSSDPNDLTYLSPGNFLTGAPLTSFPQPSLFDLSVVCLGGSTGNRSNNIFGKGDP